MNEWRRILEENRLIELGVRSVSKRGGSYQVTIPTEVVKVMRIAHEDRIVFSYDEESKRVVIGKVSRQDLEKITSLKFSVSKELADKMVYDKNYDKKRAR